MLNILYQNTFLTIASGQTAEIESTSPLYSADEYLAEKSTPIVLPWSEVNAKHFGYLYHEQTNKAKTKLDVQVFDGDTYVNSAVLVIEGSDMHFTVNGKAACRGYLLAGISAFTSAILNKKLTQLHLGGERVFDGANITQHIADTANFTFDYVFAPVANETLLGEDSEVDWMNLPINGQISPLLAFPFAKLSYVLNCIFNEHGWQLNTQFITDQSWKRLVVFGLGEVVNYLLQVPQDPNWRINLARTMPVDKNCSTFVLQICNKYGWAPICNAESRTCTLVPLNSEFTDIEDWTPYANAGSTSEYKNETKVVQFKNDFEGEDAFPQNEDKTKYTTQLTVASKWQLPTPTEAQDKSLVYTALENTYWAITLDEATNERIWYPYTDNIYSEDVQEPTHTFDTAVTTLPMRWREFGTESGQTIYALVPICKQPFNRSWGIRTLFYHGPSKCTFANGNTVNTTYPMLSSLYTDSEGTPKTTFSNVLSHKLPNGEDKGIKQFWFSKWLKLNKSLEEIERNFTLPINTLLRFNWGKIILVNNVPYFVKSYITTLPFQNTLRAKLQLLTMGNTQAALPPTPPVTIYLRLTFSNIRTNQSETIGGMFGTTYITSGTVVDYLVSAYSDAAGTLPLSVTNLAVQLRTVTTHNTAPFDDYTLTLNMSGTTTNFGILSNNYTYYKYMFVSAPGNPAPPQPDGTYENVRSLVPNGTLYVVLP